MKKDMNIPVNLFQYHQKNHENSIQSGLVSVQPIGCSQVFLHPPRRQQAGEAAASRARGSQLPGQTDASLAPLQGGRSQTREIHPILGCFLSHGDTHTAG